MLAHMNLVSNYRDCISMPTQGMFIGLGICNKVLIIFLLAKSTLFFLRHHVFICQVIEIVWYCKYWLGLILFYITQDVSCKI